MKQIWKGITLLTLCFFVSAAALAQSPDRDKDKDKDKYKPAIDKDRNDRVDKDRKDGDRKDENRLDKDLTERLSQNLYSRKPAAKDAVIVWDNTDEGYEGNYAIGDVKYMSRYDKNGNYVETLTEKKWDDNVPDNIRSSFNNSEYKSGRVEHYWEVNEPSRQGYYLDIKDTNGNSRRIWSDREGKFSDSPRRKDNNH
jgi:hypothetical protein